MSSWSLLKKSSADKFGKSSFLNLFLFHELLVIDGSYSPQGSGPLPRAPAEFSHQGPAQQGIAKTTAPPRLAPLFSYGRSSFWSS